MADHRANITPNVRIESPEARKVVGNILGWSSIALSVAVLVDGAVAELDYGNVTGPAAVIIAGLFGLYQTLITSPNVPS
jgi:hypothetical protein